MEKLSHIISQKIRDGSWKAVKVSRVGSEISHLFFADDLILFGQATAQQAKIMKNCVDLFCDVSGQQVNFEKSRIFCSPIVAASQAHHLVALCETPLFKSLGKYLGVPLIHERVTSRTYRDIIKNTQRRLAS
ncbi:hypothetical protein ACOSQ3_021785 [Xanthoceras sorbifolium]